MTPHSPSLPRTREYLIAGALLLLTLATCVTVGGIFLIGARTDITTDLEPILSWRTIVGVWTNPGLLRWGFAYALPVLAILLAHELGHYFACRRYRLPASLPFFLPSPVLMGTFGAFIRIRGALRSRRELFDVGVAGPIAGFLVLLPFMVYGVAHSKVEKLALAADPESAWSLTLPGESLLYRLLVWTFHGNLPSATILNPHPFVFAAWVGCFVTMLNLLPLSQLDGGHIVHALLGSRNRRTSRWIARVLWIALLAAGFLWSGWFVWSAITLALGLRHPPALDESVPLDRRRRWLAAGAALIFLLCFMPIPLSQIPIVQP
ncbi:MAG: site-2 protease family protein [Thermoanaerobaculia bacterium]